MNILDGVLYKNGIIIFITTNHPEKLDQALLRMGRIDMIIQLNYPREQEIKKLFIDMNDKLATEDELLVIYNKFYNYLGCSKEEFILYFQAKFKERMKWENHGEWHIDHIKPCASFNLLNEDEQKKCFHYTNLQPLWASENLSKGCKYVNETIK